MVYEMSRERLFAWRRFRGATELNDRRCERLAHTSTWAHFHSHQLFRLHINFRKLKLLDEDIYTDR